MFKGYRVSVWDDEKVLEVDGGDGCTTMNAFNMIRMVNFILYIYFAITFKSYF